MRRAATFWVTFALLFAAGCTSDPEPHKFADVPTASDSSPTPTVTDQPTVLPTKITVLILENKGDAQVRKYAWFKTMGDKYGRGTAMHGMTHPSQPNYKWIVAGSNMGYTSNTIKQVAGPSILGKTIKAGGTAGVFAQSMSSDNCRQTQRGYYHPRHGYWIGFKDERDLCEKYMVGYDKIKPLIDSGDLYDINLIVPNNCTNSHDCSLSTAEKWFKAETERLMAGPDYQQGREVIVITADEDDGSHGQVIPLIVIHPSLDHVVVTKSLNLVSLHETLAKFGHVAPLGTKYQTNPDLANAFGLQVG